MHYNTKFLDGTRFLLALWVAIGHIYSWVGYPQLFSGRLVNFLNAKAIAVDGFMVITGFLMAYHYFLREPKEPSDNRTTALKFLTRRFFRLAPCYFVVITAAFALAPVHEWLDLLTHLTFVYGVIPKYANSILDPAWSLGLEAQFYAVFPLLFLFMFKRPGIKTCLITLFASLLLQRFAIHAFGLYQDAGHFAHFMQPALLLYKLPLFLLGMMMAATALGKIRAELLFLALGLVLFGVPAAMFPQQSGMMILFIFGLLFLESWQDYLPGWVYAPFAWFKVALSGKAAVVGADLSYSLYLTHPIITGNLGGWLAKTPAFEHLAHSNTCAFGLALAINLLLCWLIFHCIEKPGINLGRKAANAIGKGQSQKLNDAPIPT